MQISNIFLKLDIREALTIQGMRKQEQFQTTRQSRVNQRCFLQFSTLFHDWDYIPQSFSFFVLMTANIVKSSQFPFSPN